MLWKNKVINFELKYGNTKNLFMAKGSMCTLCLNKYKQITKGCIKLFG